MHLFDSFMTSYIYLESSTTKLRTLAEQMRFRSNLNAHGWRMALSQHLDWNHILLSDARQAKLLERHIGPTNWLVLQPIPMLAFCTTITSPVTPRAFPHLQLRPLTMLTELQIVCTISQRFVSHIFASRSRSAYSHCATEYLIIPPKSIAISLPHRSIHASAG